MITTQNINTNRLGHNANGKAVVSSKGTVNNKVNVKIQLVKVVKEISFKSEGKNKIANIDMINKIGRGGNNYISVNTYRMSLEHSFRLTRKKVILRKYTTLTTCVKETKQKNITSNRIVIKRKNHTVASLEKDEKSIARGLKKKLFDTNDYIFETTKFTVENYKQSIEGSVKDIIYTNLYIYKKNSFMKKLTDIPILGNVTLPQKIANADLNLTTLDLEQQNYLCYMSIIILNTLIYELKIAGSVCPETFPKVQARTYFFAFIKHLALIENLLDNNNLIFKGKAEFLHKFRKKVFYGLSFFLTPKMLELIIYEHLMDFAKGKKIKDLDTRFVTHYLCKASTRLLRHYSKFYNHLYTNHFILPNKEQENAEDFPDSVLYNEENPKIKAYINIILTTH